MSEPRDTIVAIATPPGRGGVAVLRLSGPEALPIALRICSVGRLEPRRATYCRFATPYPSDPDAPALPQQRDIDDGLATYFPAPHSYTGEDTVELSCHGSEYVQQALLFALQAYPCGARLAEPGEFTMRAFLNGRLNLSQAEAVADLIDAVTPAQHSLAISQLRGGYADELRGLRQRLVDTASLLELELDFSQEDVQFADRDQLCGQIDGLKRRVDQLAASFATGQALRSGVPVAIVGPPNAGKSSLLNALVGDDRAIVSPVAGTTRDTVEDTLCIDGTQFRIVDTAGLRRTDDPVEGLGIERSRRAIGLASIILFVHDCTQPLHLPDDLTDNDPRKALVVVHNKCDLLPHVPEGDGQLILDDGSLPQRYVSTLTGQGMADLRSVLSLLGSGMRQRAGNVLVSNPRHHEALLQVSRSLQYARASLASNLPTDLVAVDLREALYHLGTITGEVSSDEVLGNIFSRFCVGK